MKIAVLSDGAWATAIASLLIGNGYSVTMWGPFADYIDEMSRTRRNDRFMKGRTLPAGLNLTASLGEAIFGAELIVLAAPVQYARATVEKLAAAGLTSSAVIVNVSKGIEVKTLKRMSEICLELLGPVRYAVISGPSHAEEVINRMPTVVVAASTAADVPLKLQNVFRNDMFRVYTSDDVIGVELGGALKNVFAIAAGICDGIGLGDNAKAALITRGIVEMARLGQALGGRPETFSGLSGVGDIIVTCFSKHSRNRYVGEELGKGVALETIVHNMGMVVAEGVQTTRSAYHLARKLGIDTPIVNEVYAGLFEGKDVRDGVRDLMTREAGREN